MGKDIRCARRSRWTMPTRVLLPGRHTPCSAIPLPTRDVPTEMGSYELLSMPPLSAWILLQSMGSSERDITAALDTTAPEDARTKPATTSIPARLTSHSASAVHALLDTIALNRSSHPAQRSLPAVSQTRSVPHTQSPVPKERTRRQPVLRLASSARLDTTVCLEMRRLPGPSLAQQDRTAHQEPALRRQSARLDRGVTPNCSTARSNARFALEDDSAQVLE